jgi:ATP-binding cassette subfamily B protein
MVSKYLQMPFHREVIHRILTEQMKRQGTILFQLCAYLSELIGLKAQLANISTSAFTIIPTPALIHYGDSFAVLYETSDRALLGKNGMLDM